MSSRIKKAAALVLVALAATFGADATRAETADLFKRLALYVYKPSTKPPDFTGRTAEGKTVSLASLRGKVVIVNFWASWCRECRPEMPLFEQLHREFAARGLAVVGINAREGTAVVRSFRKEQNLTFPLALDANGEIQEAYSVIGLPTTFLIARDGRAVALAVGPRAWSSAAAKTVIMTLLAE
jgi:peroxiredoxin